MSELDDRIANGLREFVDRAPGEADVWAETERHIGRQKHRRRAVSGAVVAVIAVAAAAVALVNAGSANSTPRVQVATTAPATGPATTTATAPTSSAKAPAATAATATTTPDTAPPIVTTVVVCPTECVGRTTADVDGDGRPDQIGLSADPPLSGDATGNRPSKLVVRVAFANGQVAEYDDTASWDASLVGAIDLNGDGSAEIFYFYFTGANNRMGRILRWDGSHLVAVQGSDGKPFTTFTSGYALGADGFRCGADSYIAMTIGDDGPSPSSPTGWSGSEITYRLNGNALLAVTTSQPIAITDRPAGVTSDLYIPPEYDQVIGVHCPGVTPGYPYTPTSP